MTMAGTRVHAFADDALAADDAVGLVARMRDGAVSAAEIVDAAVARAERVQPALHGLCYQAFDHARAEARDPRPGYFSGIPTVVKDNVDVAGMPTQHGSRAWVARMAKSDGDVARVLRGTGLVLLGKTQLSEFGFNASAEFPDDDPVHNPWHTDHSSGASSAGSAAFVAAGVVPIAHANDGGGSIRIPASCCGLVGLKPTRGRMPSDKMMREMPVKIVADGVVTRSVRDTAVFYREAEKIYRNLELPPIGDIRGPARRRLRIALVTQSRRGPGDRPGVRRRGGGRREAAGGRGTPRGARRGADTGLLRRRLQPLLVDARGVHERHRSVHGRPGVRHRRRQTT